MKDRSLLQAYNEKAPDTETKARMLRKIQDAAAKGETTKPTVGRQVLLIAACLVLLAALTFTGYAMYRKWSLPEPTPYELTEQGAYAVHEKNEYQISSVEVTPVEESPVEDTPLTDSDFIRMAASLLQDIGLTDVDSSTMTVTRQNHLSYDREEAEVDFSSSAVRTTVTYEAETGALLSLSSIDLVEVETVPVEDPAALATDYYEKLPVAQGYVLTGCTEYDEQYWSYEFCRQVTPEIYNTYEMVRVAINPVSGRLTGCNVFYFPLLDDHAEADVPLTQEEAQAIAEQAVPVSRYTLESAEVQIVLPNWSFSEYAAANLQYAQISRYGWVFTYENKESEFADMIRVWVDLYTGEVLGGDHT